MEPETKLKVLGAMETLRQAVKQLNDVYDEFPDLNNIQPGSFEKIIPKSLDEWYGEIQSCIGDWETLVHAPLRKYTVILTRDVTESVAVDVEANCPGAAADRAMHLVENENPIDDQDGERKWEWEVDELSEKAPYVTGTEDNGPVDGKENHGKSES